MIYFSYPDNFKNNMKYRSENLKEGIKLEEQILEPDKFKISYPVVDNTKNKENISNINNAIINEVGELFKSQALVDGVVDFNQILGDYEVTLNESGILSILFSMYIYVNRAAHGYTKYSSITVNIENGRVYSFSDLFNSKVNYTAVLNELAKQYIEQNNITLINEYNGITPDQEYYLTPTSLVIYYQVYDYTPYVHGLFKIEIPYEKIKNIISPVGPIAQILNNEY
ncbi:DUF3298 domain-containing protein [Clostridium tyrobutyricum]|jgi:hypothetical protein|uniref:Putative anti-SigV factor n=3 Tax=Clostridium tyrobutyricum TaxID=1519 RepID=W6N4B9_CLOTY|nr:RsiV family protein [Clostridium tyrobutyricum]AND84961.1 hypothetical protein CTK_C17060 [Clostridium tyrobutyricum]ANP69527.1 anti-SigV factor [Clostridium tyrobutyricum]MBR9648510.1 DUF3298 domain-containing protein [Clostridium tyrobutyricum]MBV4414789.1 RsiV family protein [Clostridium tyrobutyricum]MBV4422409.1 RsiV family protein [Clostridium tyrobutyricum]